MLHFITKIILIPITFVGSLFVFNRPDPIPTVSVTPTIEATVSVSPINRPIITATPKKIYITPSVLPIPTIIPTLIPTLTPTPTVKNYRSEAILRVNNLLAIEESYKLWLVDTSNQFRTTSITLASKPSSGGLVQQIRDQAIQLANKEVTVISNLLSRTQQDISNLQAYKDLLNNSPTILVRETDFNSLRTTGYMENDIAQVKASINDTLMSAMSALQY